MENQRKTKEKMDRSRLGRYPDDGNKRVEKTEQGKNGMEENCREG